MSEMTFEKALEKLESIVSDMESEEVSLESSLKKFEEGIKMVRFCKEKLEKAEKRIEILSKDADGGMSTKPFDPAAISPDNKVNQANNKRDNTPASDTFEDELPF